NIMRKFLLSLLVVALTLPASAGIRQNKANKDTNQFRYEIECAGNAIQGTYLVKVWSYSKKASVAENQCRKNAVHGIIFKGYGGGQGCVSQRPMANQPGIENQYKDYFNSFFAEGGEFQKYASIMEGTTEIVKVGKEYKVGVVVSVRKDDLRKALEAAGIIRGLNSGF
ncbi:MAG: hypothetical protein J6T71_01055, partial [Paludibacteraceae bacterium]|nr:hypothetical protein [Paludibacteraceae bacterium]